MTRQITQWKRSVFRLFVLSVASLSSGLGACDGTARQGASTISEDGPEMCFDAIRTALSPETKVATIFALYAPSQRVFRDPEVTPNELITCEVAYENPNEPDKLLALKMDPRRRVFDSPVDVDFAFPPGSPGSDIAQFLIPLGQVKTSNLASLMHERELQFDNPKSAYSWTSFRLKAPGPFNDTHVLRLELKARIGAEEFPEIGAMELSIDGRQILWEDFPNGLRK